MLFKSYSIYYAIYKGFLYFFHPAIPFLILTIKIQDWIICLTALDCVSEPK